NLFRLVTAESRKSIRGRGIAGETGGVDAQAEDAGGREHQPGGAQKLPHGDQQMVEAELGARQLVALLALARGREEGRRVGRRRGHGRLEEFLVLRDLRPPGDRVAEPDGQEEYPGEHKPAVDDAAYAEARRVDVHRRASSA